MAEDDPGLTTTGTQYLVADHLGSTRMVLGSDGTCVHRIDYLPFGGESPRTEPCYGGDPPTNPSSVSLKFTGKERDGETNLDYFGARYYSGAQGRFMSADPLLSSANPWDLQTWNRYSYALNNPLKFVDPNGLYNLVNECKPNDSNCHHQFQQDAAQLKAGLASLQKKVNKMKDGAEKGRLQAALGAMGTENDKNNVSVKFVKAKPKDTAAARTELGFTEGKLGFTVTFNTNKINFGGTLNGWAMDAAHEGTHIADYSDSRMLDFRTELSNFSVEYRGYQTSAWAAEALGEKSLKFKEYLIWNQGWAEVDDKALTNYLKGMTFPNGKPSHLETFPHNPWDN